MRTSGERQRKTKAATSPTIAGSEPLEAARLLPNGARFYRCALQVNPFAYLERHGKSTNFRSEADYNAAIVRACCKAGIEVVAVTDHYRVETSRALLRACREAGLFAFTGFEAVTKDGVHFLCIFDPEQEARLERVIGDCGVHDSSAASPVGSLDSLELLAKAREWGAVAIAAHVASNGGLLKTLSGQPRINAWTSPDLLACALPGATVKAPDGIRRILENKDPQHRRTRAVAVVNASDVNDPADLEKDSASCFIKMSKVSVEAFRQAFLDSWSRIRLHSDPPSEPHAELVAAAWEGGFLDGVSVRFNGNLNTLIGGRGTGKSTVIESIRYALGLDPLGDEARKMHEETVRHVLKPGTKVSLLVRSHHPSEAHYAIERTVPNPPVVRDDAGNLLAMAPRELMPGAQVFGQHEISELTGSPERLTSFIERRAGRDASLSAHKAEMRLVLEKSRLRIVETWREIEELMARLDALPGLEETQKRFREAGLEERFRERSLLVREERLFSILDERLEPFRALLRALGEDLPIDAAFVSARALASLPNADILRETGDVLQTLGARLDEARAGFAAALTEADAAITDIRERWDERRGAIESAYEKLLRDHQKSGIDGAEFIELRKQLEYLRPLKDRLEHLRKDMEMHEAHRRDLVSEWEDIKAREYRALAKAAKEINGKLRQQVKVEVRMAGDREPLENLLRTVVGGNLAAALERLHKSDPLSLPGLSQCCREGKDSLISTYDLPPGAAERIADAGRDLHMKIEELELPATTHIELNTAPKGEPEAWRPLEALSKGQKATAVLLLLLLDAEAPLVIDQPEDDLDNRFIAERIVPIVRREKRRRQFVFSTHNANIPVLGDAELILGLAASGEAGGGQANIAPEHMGSIDSEAVRELVEETLEGGRNAFEMRRSKYGF